MERKNNLYDFITLWRKDIFHQEGRWVLIKTPFSNSVVNKTGIDFLYFKDS